LISLYPGRDPNIPMCLRLLWAITACYLSLGKARAPSSASSSASSSGCRYSSWQRKVVCSGNDPKEPRPEGGTSGPRGKGRPAHVYPTDCIFNSLLQVIECDKPACYPMPVPAGNDTELSTSSPSSSLNITEDAASGLAAPPAPLRSRFDPWRGVLPRLIEDEFPGLQQAVRVPAPSIDSTCAVLTSELSFFK